MKQINRLYPKPVTDPKPGGWRAFRESPRGRKGIAGSSLVEFAVVVPLLMTLVMAMFVFGIAMNQYLTLTNATTSGAQVSGDCPRANQRPLQYRRPGGRSSIPDSHSGQSQILFRV